MSAAHTRSITIDCEPDTVYGFVSNPLNLPCWAPGMTDADFAIDIATVERDVARLKSVLEK